MAVLTILTCEEKDSWRTLLDRLKQTTGEALLVLPSYQQSLSTKKSDIESFIDGAKELSSRLRIATKNEVVIRMARKKGIRAIDRSKDLQSLLKGHKQHDEALRVFSPHAWQQQLRSQLQATGLLSLPKLRIWMLIGVTFVTFAFVVLKLLPSATVTVAPREESITHTSNIYLVLSGATTTDLPERGQKMELVPITVELEQTSTFDQISKEFIGTNAKTYMTVVNDSDEKYSLREGSRLANQAGMVFKIQDPINVDPGEEVTVLAIADDLDLYGEIIGDRGNVPADLKWEFVGLAPEEFRVIWAENRQPATGGETLFRTVLHEDDLIVARKQLEDQLLKQTNQLVDEKIELMNARSANKEMTRLYYDELTKLTFTGFVLPREYLGERITSVPVSGKIRYTAYAYDAQYVLEFLEQELHKHVENGKELDPATISLDRLNTHVIDYETEDLSWIKLTVDLSGVQRPILNPLTPSGARFASELRDAVLGVSTDEALRIVKNFPEVEKVDVDVWPPWNDTLPDIPSHITIQQAEE